MVIRSERSQSQSEGWVNRPGQVGDAAAFEGGCWKSPVVELSQHKQLVLSLDNLHEQVRYVSLSGSENASNCSESERDSINICSTLDTWVPRGLRRDDIM